MLPFGEGGTVLNVSKQLGPGYVCQFWRLRNQDIIMEETCASRNGNRFVGGAGLSDKCHAVRVAHQPSTPLLVRR